MIALRVFTYLMVAFLLLPIALVLATSFTTANVISFPPQGFTLRWYEVILNRAEFLESLRLSLTIALIVSAVSTTLGCLAALALVRYRFPGRDLIQAAVMSPLVLPTVVIGIALLLFLSRIGLSGSPAALVIGHVIVTLPYAVRLISSSLAGLDRTLERAARNLGADSFTTFRRITLPLIQSGLIASVVFTFIVSFDDLTISIFLATPSMVTLPVRIYSYIENVTQPYIASAGAIVILAATVLIVIIERVAGVRRVVSG